MYAVKKSFQGNKRLCTLCNGKLVALNEAFEHHIQAGKAGPAQTKVVPLATQAQLSVLYNQGNPCIEVVPDLEPAPEQDAEKRKSKKELLKNK